ncbi:MAG TPA: hypothetical protein VKT78_05540 [Fimbriimonadaceae bacterium]|nr:hypothetical protein [Fimbriimonadaceae bacterium]
MTPRFLVSLFIGACVLATAAPALAQGPPPPRQGVQGGRMGGPGGMRMDPKAMEAARMKRMEEELTKLHASKSQKEKVFAYMKRTGAQRQAYMKSHQGMDRDAMRKQFEKWRDEMTAFMKRTLSGKQFKQYQADMEAARKARMGGMRGGPGGGGGPRGGKAG